MHTSIKALLVAGAIFAIGCDSSIPDAKSNRRQSNVQTTEQNGVVTADINASATSHQTIVASSTSEVAESAIIFPPGSLTINTSVSLGTAVDKSSTIATEVGLTTAIAKAAAPLYAAPATGDIPTLSGQIAIVMPLPIQDMKVSGLTTISDAGKLVFFYLINTTEGWKSGVKPLTAADLKGTFLNTTVTGFGYFQIAYLADKVEAKEVVTQTRPSLKNQQQ